MPGSVPDLRAQIEALVDGSISLDQFMAWYWANHDTIEFEGSDEDVALLNRVFHVYAEYTSDYIDAAQLVDALRADPLVVRELATHRITARWRILDCTTAHSGYRP